MTKRSALAQFNTLNVFHDTSMPSSFSVLAPVAVSDSSYSEISKVGSMKESTESGELERGPFVSALLSLFL